MDRRRRPKATLDTWLGDLRRRLPDGVSDAARRRQDRAGSPRSDDLPRPAAAVEDPIQPAASPSPSPLPVFSDAPWSGGGASVPLGPDVASFGAMVVPNEPWDALIHRWQGLEAAGVDSLWGNDHFTSPHLPGEPWLEGWATLTAMAMATSRVQVGLLVGAIVSRSPMLLAKQAQVVDHASGGRLVVGLGAGGAPTDQAMWGEEPWSPRERADRFHEYVTMVDALLRDGEVTFHGRWHATTGAAMAPGFVQSPRPPITLAAHGPRTLATTARVADTWNVMGPTLDAARTLGAELDRACERIERDPASLRRSVLIGVTDATDSVFTTVPNRAVWTTSDRLVDVVLQWAGEGFREFVFYDPPPAEPGGPPVPADVLSGIVADALPRLRRELA